MTALIAIDIFAAVLVLIGFNVAFRQRAVRSMLGRSPRDPSATEGGPDELASVFRIVGVMLMAFGVTVCVFANLIAYYSRAA